jgi:YegS/Rv2252/BmrU family lipid kinase
MMANTIALIAHEQQGDELAVLMRQHSPVFSRYELIAPEPLNNYLQRVTGLPIAGVQPNHLGGDIQIAAQVVAGEVIAVICLLDFANPQSLNLDILALLRVCQIYNIPLATNYATAEAIILGLAQTRLAHLIFNPVAGQGDAQQDLELIQQLLEPHMNLQVQLTTPTVDAAELAQAAVAAQADLVIASGGDGTVSAVAGALIGTEIPLGIIPRGTANAFCLALGIPATIASIRRSCQTILSGKPRRVDAARCNGNPMILLAGIGYEAATVDKANRDLKDRWGPMAYLIAGWQQLNEQEPFETELEVEGNWYQFRAAAITIANAAPPTSVLAQGAGAVIFDDGLLDVTIATGINNFQTVGQKLQAVKGMAQMMGAALIGTAPELENLFHFRTQWLRITTKPAQKIVIDGEVLAAASVEIACVPNGLMVLVPSAIV